MLELEVMSDEGLLGVHEDTGPRLVVKDLTAMVLWAHAAVHDSLGGTHHVVRRTFSPLPSLKTVLLAAT